jgi:hypothetical protein
MRAIPIIGAQSCSESRAEQLRPSALRILSGAASRVRGVQGWSDQLHEEYTSRFWATAYDFPAAKDGRVKKEILHNGEPSRTQGWYFNTRRDLFKDPRVREAIGLCFDFAGPTRTSCTPPTSGSSLTFPTRIWGEGQARSDESLLEPFRDKLAPPFRRPLRSVGVRWLRVRPQAPQAGIRPPPRGGASATGRR